jgi:hypothetical protein
VSSSETESELEEYLKDIVCAYENEFEKYKECLKNCIEDVNDEWRKWREMLDKMREACKKCDCDLEYDEDYPISNPDVVCHGGCTEEERQLCETYLYPDSREALEYSAPDWTESDCVDHCLELTNCWIRGSEFDPDYEPDTEE